MLRATDRVLRTLVAGAIGLAAIVPGWQLMTDGSVFGYKMPTDMLSSNWPFGDYFLAGLILMVVIGAGGVATAVAAIADDGIGVLASLAYGIVLVGWIAGELIFLTQTMLLTWVILGSGVLLIALAAPYAWAQVRAALGSGRRFGAA